jgi:hypothetical protein
MANFRTHVTFSTVLGIGYAGAGMLWGAPIDTSLVAGALCGVSGMLPDIDSDSGVPVRESLAFLAATLPLLLFERLHSLGLTPDTMILVGVVLYLIVRFGFAAFLKSYTVHRGMFHSIPAAVLFAELAFLFCGGYNLELRYFKAGAVLLGFMSHLFLDEIYSIDFSRGIPRFKKTFGTAIKFWGKDLGGNLSVYFKLIVVTCLVLGEPAVLERLGHPPQKSVYETANQAWQKLTR